MAGRPKLTKPKKFVGIYLDEGHLFIAKKYKVDFRSIMVEAFEKTIYAHIGGEEHLDEEIQKIIDAELGQVESMIAHIKAGVAAGVHRGKMEMDFGWCFPEALWTRYGHSAETDKRLLKIYNAEGGN